MKPRTLLPRASIAAVTVSTALLAACSGDPSGRPEATRSSAAAATVDQVFTIGEPYLASFFKVALANSSVIFFDNDVIIQLPSLTSPPFKMTPIPPIPVSPMSFTSGGTTSTATLDGLSVDMSSITVAYNGTGFVVSGSGSASFGLHTTVIGPVNPQVSVSAALSATFSYSPEGDNLVLLPETLLATSSSVSVSGCGGFGWCNGIVQDKIDVNNLLQSAAQQPLSQFISSSSVTQVVRAIMLIVADQDSPPPSNQTQWEYIPNSAYVGNGGLNYQMVATTWPATTPPPNCAASRDCNDMYIYCNEVPSPVTQQVTGGSIIETTTVSGQNAYVVTPGNYTVCDVDTYNSTSVCQSVAEPGTPSVCSCPSCPAGYMCEINDGVGRCVVNHLCPVGYHYCSNGCVKQSILCPSN